MIRLKRGGKAVLTETKTFDRRPAAANWMEKRERELAQPGGLEAAQLDDPLLSAEIDRYIRESRKTSAGRRPRCPAPSRPPGSRSMHCSKIGSREIMQFAQSLGVLPQTVGRQRVGRGFKYMCPTCGTYGRQILRSPSSITRTSPTLREPRPAQQP